MSDVSSVILRDFILWATFLNHAGETLPYKLLKREKYNVLASGLEQMFRQPSVFSDVGMERFINFEIWGSLR